MPEFGEGLSSEVIDTIRAGFEATYLRLAPAEWLASDAGQAEVHREIVDKWALCARHVVPWVERTGSLAGCSMVEVGCGTGAKTAAFAPHVKSVDACDMSADHLAAADRRVRAMGLTNVALTVGDAASFAASVRDAHPDGIDLCLMFAVLEHMTLDERLSALEEFWAMLSPGGRLVVLETPNRLLPWDWHSSRLPFFNMLPDDLALRYFDRSPRSDYVADLRSGIDAGRGRDALARSGRGVSYHEFELVFGALGNLIVADGYDAELVEMNPIILDEMELERFLRRETLDVPPAFSRYWIELVLKKPDGTAQQPLAPPTWLVPADHGEPVLQPGTPDLEYRIPSGARETIVVFGDGTAGADVSGWLDGRTVGTSRARRGATWRIDCSGAAHLGLHLESERTGPVRLEHVLAR
jgi:S-adenosylmethionine-dependent methyltransferase